VQDFDSAALKTKKHWQSFTCDVYFRSLSSVLQDLNTYGWVKIDEAACKAVMEQPMICTPCNATLKNIPDLKRHLDSDQHKALLV
jgi:aprataxin